MDDFRAGNGEQTHFAEAGRYLANETEFVANMLELLKHFIVERRFPKPPLLFLATDTPYLIPSISNTTRTFGVETVVLHQIRLEAKAGVTFSALKGQDAKCLLGWRAMVSDMLLLADSDVLLAARHSSFTQSLPLSLVFDRKENLPLPEQKDTFCEMSSNATRMTCFDDILTWLFRDESSGRMRNYALEVEKDPDERVQHKLLVHFEDTEPVREVDEALTFLRGPPTQNENGAPYEPRPFGATRYYRRFKQGKEPLGAKASWNFTG